MIVIITKDLHKFLKINLGRFLLGTFSKSLKQGVTTASEREQMLVFIDLEEENIYRHGVLALQAF